METAFVVERSFSFDPRVLHDWNATGSNHSSRDEYELPEIPNVVLHFMFGFIVFVMVCSLSRTYRREAERVRQEEEARQRQAEIDQTEAPALLRASLEEMMKANQIMVTLSSEDFMRRVDLDIEKGTDISSNDNDFEKEVEITTAKKVEEIQNEKVAIETCSKSEIDENVESRDVHGEILLPKEDPLGIPDQCAICLDRYEAGQTVVWSNNAECQHAFHKECILEYLVYHKDGSSAPCPCCRQPFLEKQSKQGWFPNQES